MGFLKLRSIQDSEEDSKARGYGRHHEAPRGAAPRSFIIMVYHPEFSAVYLLFIVTLETGPANALEP